MNENTIRLNSKGNEVIIRCSFSIWLCLLLSNHHHCICYHCQYLLHHIYVSWVSNDDVHQGLKVICNDNDIHSLSSVEKEKVENLPLNIYNTFQNNSYDNISKCIMNCCTFTLARAPKQWVLKLLMVWPHLHREDRQL